MIDLVILNKSMAKIVVLSENQELNADCCEDGKVNSSDAYALLKYLVLVIDVLPITPQA